MKIKYLQISNILSFKYFDNILDAPKINFDDGLNILIGENGSGKTTAMEVINFILKKVLFKKANIRQDLYDTRVTISQDRKREVLSIERSNTYTEFKLVPNWNTEDCPQKIRFSVILDEVDKQNIQHIIDEQEKLKSMANLYARSYFEINNTQQFEYTIEIILDGAKKVFSVIESPTSDSGYLYLENYNFYKELIELYNSEYLNEPIDQLYETFTLIGGYRNYNAFSPAISLQSTEASQQIQQAIGSEFLKSLHANENSEPLIFNLVRLKAAKLYYDLEEQPLTPDEKKERANNQLFLKKINNKLRLINLECKINLLKRQTWQYSFELVDIKRNKKFADINSLSAGQKAILHLVFEAYGRSGMKGGVVIVDEPEIHLHHQFQHEYLRMIEELNQEQSCQYILITHSDSLINSKTIKYIKRFFLDEVNNTLITAPELNVEQKKLVKILDNTRAAYALFARKVILVEGEDDRYFFKALLNEIEPDCRQEIAILDIGGKGQYEAWKNFFKLFGLRVYFIGDWDNSLDFFYPDEKGYKLDTQEKVSAFKAEHSCLNEKIEHEYTNRIFILKEGKLEDYLGIHNKGLSSVIVFCEQKITEYLKDTANAKAKELELIMRKIIDD